jgi:hypothetical protein
VKTTSQLLAVGRSYNPNGGAPLGNRNALKTGQHTGRNRALRRQVTAFIRTARAIAARVEARVKERGRAGKEA